MTRLRELGDREARIGVIGLGYVGLPLALGRRDVPLRRSAEVVFDRVVPVSSTQGMVKLLENTFRAINIGLVNEVAVMCHRLGLDVWEVIDAAATTDHTSIDYARGDVGPARL